MQDQAKKDCVEALNHIIDDVTVYGVLAASDSDALQELADHVLPVLLRDTAVDEPSNLEYPDVENWLNGLPLDLRSDAVRESIADAILSL